MSELLLNRAGRRRSPATMPGFAQNAIAEDRERAEALPAEALDHAEQSNAELRELAHGILLSVLTRRGLLAGVDALVSRLDLEVDVDVTSTRLPPEIEASAYFIVAEALTNVVSTRRLEAHRLPPRYVTVGCASRYATTVSAAPTRAVTGCWELTTAWRHSEGGCVSTARRARGRC